MTINKMIVFVNGERVDMEDIDFIQITHGNYIDFRQPNDNIVYGTSIKDKMIFIHIGVDT